MDITDKEFDKLYNQNVGKFAGCLGVRVTKEENNKLYVLIKVEGGYDWRLPTPIQLKNINNDSQRKCGKIYNQ